jgi:hypothetical protein
LAAGGQSRSSRSGLPIKSPARENRRLKDYLVRFPFKTARELKKEVPGWDDLHTAEGTELVLPLCCWQRSWWGKDMPLQQKTINTYLHWTEKDWRVVVFSDESTFKLFSSQTNKVTWSSTVVATNRNSRFQWSTPSDGLGIFQWQERNRRVVFSASGLHQELFKDTNRSVLDEHLTPHMRMHNCRFFLQNGAPCHKSKMVIDTLKKFQKEFGVLEWPGNSPDVNPVANCWSHMKKKLKYQTAITFLPQLITAIKQMWQTDMGSPYFQKPAGSVTRRLQMVINQKGEMTKY